MEDKTHAFVGATGTRMGFIFVAEIITIVIGNFLASFDVPYRNDPDLSPNNIGLGIGIAGVIDVSSSIIRHVAVD